MVFYFTFGTQDDVWVNVIRVSLCSEAFVFEEIQDSTPCKALATGAF